MLLFPVAFGQVILLLLILIFFSPTDYVAWTIESKRLFPIWKRDLILSFAISLGIWLMGLKLGFLTPNIVSGPLRVLSKCRLNKRTNNTNIRVFCNIIGFCSSLIGLRNSLALLGCNECIA